MINDKIFSYQSLYMMRFAIPPLLTILLGKSLFEILLFDFSTINNQIKIYLISIENNISPKISFQETKARLFWISSVLLYLFINIGFFAFLYNILKKRTRSELIRVVIIILIVGTLEIIYLFSVDSASSPTNNLFHFSFDSLAATKLFSADKLTMIFYILSIINLIAIIIIPCAIMTGCCIVSTKAESLTELNQQYILLKEFIKGSSAIMIVGVIHMQLWLYWPLSLMSEYSNIIGLKGVISTIIQYWGICYSLTIAALYLPITNQMRKQRHLFQDIEEISPHQLEINSLFQSITTQLPQIVAILGPVLIGSISPSLTSIISL